MEEYFYSNVDIDHLSTNSTTLINRLKEYSKENARQVILLNKPLSEPKFEYSYDSGVVVLIPGYKCIFVDLGNNSDKFEAFKEDFLEDLGYISDKYNYKKILGRPRQWRNDYFESIQYTDFEKIKIEDKIEELKLTEENQIRISEMIISLLIGSINQIDKIFCENNVPQNLLEKVKKKIILFDSDQTRFIYQEPKKKRILIQGLAGTGKTELLLHKLKDLYVKEQNSKICFTCYNVILAKNLKNRINNFFDFMKVDEQIKWEDRLWTIRSWGSKFVPNSGIYSYICQYYDITFYNYYEAKSFKTVCKRAIEELKQKINETEKSFGEKGNILNEDGTLKKCFDYILIDEGQDFPEEFFELCEMVTSKNIYIAGDIFQDIFERKIIGDITPDFLLNKCYRTDPRTLMFAQGIGMGLFDKTPPLRWLKDEEWRACGYNIEREDNKVLLSRTPLRRFEDLKDFISMEIMESDTQEYLKRIMDILRNLKESYDTLLPDDIGIIFLEQSNNDNYILANKISIMVKEEFGWDVNKGYETKEKINNTLFISNRNNVKGLEFPFVICVTRNTINNSMTFRNSIYMMLTRSFLTSYFILPKEDPNIDKFKQGLEEINSSGKLSVIEPSEEEKNKIMDIVINQECINKSIREVVDEIIEEKGIDKCKYNKIHKLVNVFIGENEEWSKEYLEEIILNNIGFIKDE